MSRISRLHKTSGRAKVCGKDFEIFVAAHFTGDFLKTLHPPNDTPMKKLWFLPVLALISACALDADRLTGRWRAVALYQAGQKVAAPLDSVRLIFHGMERFEFHSAGFYYETGPFRTSGKHLFLTDTTLHPAKEHTLKVLYLSDDTLKIQMKKEAAEQVLFLAKDK